MTEETKEFLVSLLDSFIEKCDHLIASPAKDLQPGQTKGDVQNTRVLASRALREVETL